MPKAFLYECIATIRFIIGQNGVRRYKFHYRQKARVASFGRYVRHNRHFWFSIARNQKIKIELPTKYYIQNLQKIELNPIVTFVGTIYMVKTDEKVNLGFLTFLT